MLLKKHKDEKLNDYDDFSKESNFLRMLDNTIQSKQNIDIHDTNYNLAYTDLEDIYIDFDEAKNIIMNNDKKSQYFNFIVLIKALNYHELSHILYTRYSPMKMYKKAKDEKRIQSLSDDYIDKFSRFVRTLNVLEDQRIENLFVKKYLKSKYYFNHMYGLTIFGNTTSSNLYMSFPLLYGRRFIIDDKNIMIDMEKMFRKSFPEIDIEQVKSVIDEYIVTFDVNRQIALAKKFMELLPEKVVERFKCMTREIKLLESQKQRNGNPSKEEREACDALKKLIASGNGKHLDMDVKPYDIDGTNVSVSETMNKSQNRKEDCDDLKKKMLDNGNKNAEKLRHDTENTYRAIGKNDFKSFIGSESKRQETYKRHYYFNPSDIDMSTIRKMEDMIRRIRNDVDNKTFYRQRRGKLSMRHAMMNQSYKLNDFKKHIPSRRDKVNLDVTMVLDSSGSMSFNNFNTVLKCAWSISKTIENTKGTTRVLEFSHEYEIVKERDESTDTALWGRRFFNGTKAVYPLRNVVEDLSKNGKSNSIVFILSDGYFSDTIETAEIVHVLRSMGIYVAWFLILDAVTPRDELILNGKYIDYDRVIMVDTFDSLYDELSKIIYDLQERAVSQVRINSS